VDVSHTNHHVVFGFEGNYEIKTYGGTTSLKYRSIDLFTQTESVSGGKVKISTIA
jgi:hypothetical protein